MKHLTTLLLTLILSANAWAEDEFCPNSKITCPQDSTKCIEKFWSKNSNLLDKVATEAKKTLPRITLGGLTWIDVMYEAENRRLNYIYTTDDEKRALDVLSKTDLSRTPSIFNHCATEKGMLCIVPGLTVRMVTDGESKKVIDVKNFSREICRARGYR